MKFESVDHLGSVRYFKDEKRTILHNEDGPAILNIRGEKQYYLDGKWVTEEWFNKMKEVVLIDGISQLKLELWRASNYSDIF